MNEVELMSKEELQAVKKDLVILFVDDNEKIRDQMVRGLESVFDTVIPAEDGLDALRVMEKIYVDVVVSDINMPKMDGVELIKKVRENEKVKPIIVTTAYDDFREVYKSIPNISLLIKPYTIYDVIKCINRSEALIEANKHQDDNFKKLAEVSEIAKNILRELKGA